ncbi:MAG: Nif3-like dinuclear metal center hexameric protein [Brumimicrobium sp.]|nr:Nif3-like dinuclear metal center hexameric protein [Brumimicrobium sp.]
MELKIKDITRYLESLAPLSSQESYDNSGLLVGDSSQKVKGILLTLDCTEDIVEEAIRKNLNLIVAHHPIVFKGLKKINGKNYVERTVIKAIKNDVAIYAIHTNLDNYRWGVNFEIGKRIGLKNMSVLQPKVNTLKKLIVFCPSEDKDKVLKAMFGAGAGNIGNYSACSFETEGTGAFLPEEHANPAKGSIGKRESVDEMRLEVIFSHAESAIIEAMKSAHPYEEPAYDIVPLGNENAYEGSGMIGELEKPVETRTFLSDLKKTFGCGVIRHTSLVNKTIRKVAFCGGSGSFLLPQAKAAGADIFITGDFKYHEFFDAEEKIIIADIGHYESEQFTPHLIHDVLKKKFINFAVHLSEVNTNPINYF